MKSPTCDHDKEPADFRRCVEAVVNCLESDWDWTINVLDTFMRFSATDKKIGLPSEYTWYGQRLLSDFLNPPKSLNETKKEENHERLMATQFILRNSGVPAAEMDPLELVECLFTVYCRYRTNQPIGITELTKSMKKKREVKKNPCAELKYQWIDWSEFAMPSTYGNYYVTWKTV